MGIVRDNQTIRQIIPTVKTYYGICWEIAIIFNKKVLNLHRNWLKAFRVILKACLGLIDTVKVSWWYCESGFWLIIFGGKTQTFVIPTIQYHCTVGLKQIVSKPNICEYSIVKFKEYLISKIVYLFQPYCTVWLLKWI